VHVKRVLNAGRRMLPPQPVDQHIARHGLVRAEHENRQQRELFVASDVQHAAIDASLDRPEQPVIDHRRGPPNQPSVVADCTPRAAVTKCAL